MSVREIRIFIHWRNTLRKLCKIVFSSNDASLYLFPYAVQGNYFFGRNTMPNQQASQTFNFTEDIFQKDPPKLSIHESGRIHVKVGKIEVGPLWISPLVNLRGQHIASVSSDAFEALPIFTEMLKNNSSNLDLIIPAMDDAISGRLSFYINGNESSFDGSKCPITFTNTRTTTARPLYFGIKPIGQPKISLDTPKGATIIAGWNPEKQTDEELDYLYIRGE